VTGGILLCELRILTSISGSNKPKVVEGGLRRPPMTDRLWFGLPFQGQIRDCSRRIRSLQGTMEFGATNLCFFANASVLDFLAFSEMTCFSTKYVGNLKQFSLFVLKIAVFDNLHRETDICTFILAKNKIFLFLFCSDKQNSVNPSYWENRKLISK
jgi:hypothetical protein